MSSSTAIAYLFFFLANSCLIINIVEAQPPPPPPPPPPLPRITILGSVYCDVCYENTFSKHSYFLPGVDVNVECKVKARSAKSSEEISFSANRSTDMYGMYRVEIPAQDQDQDPTVHSFCRATLIDSNKMSNICSLPSRKGTTSSKMRVVRSSSSGCTYTIGALSYRPPRRNATLCRNLANQDSFNSSKFFLPYFPPYVFPWPPFPQLPPLPPFPQLPPLPPFPQLPPLPPFPQLPPLPQLPPFPQLPPLPPLPSLPPFPQNPPSLPFPFPSVPPPAPPSPGFNLGDPRTWIPQPQPPPPPFNFWDPNTWIPHPPPPINPTAHTP